MTDPAVRGALAGTAATLVMSAVMLCAGRIGLMGRQPPERVVERGLEEMGEVLDARELDVTASIAHVAFGAACGAAFGVLAGVVPASRADRLGVPYALVIWLVSYFGWIPAAGILPLPPEDRPGRVWTMLAAHVVYGLSLGALWRALRRHGS